MDAVLAEDRGAACGHPHSGQCVAVNLVLLDHALAFLMLEHNRGAGEDLQKARHVANDVYLPQRRAFTT